MAQARAFSLRGSSRTGLLLAAVLAAVTGVLVYAALRSATGGEESAAGGGAGSVSVVVAARDIPAGAVISPGMVRLAQVDADQALQGALASTEAAVGQVARIPIYAGEQLVAAKLTTDPVREGLAYVVPAGMRAMAVEVNKVIAAGGNVRPGDRVDVYAVIEAVPEDASNVASGRIPLSVLLAQDVEVLAVEQRIIKRAPGAAPSEGTLADQPEPDPEATVVTLALPPDVALRVLLADERGSIRLAVRPAGDDGVAAAMGVTQDDLAAPATGRR
ncbi:MAG: Flp pilus assembly protein CpaB [Chloroflexota bacterium]|nr:Flp pilus assembly protein CpaB [Dehalococcoidia bacterium]MDW8045850.1 Flp pilus assembly protein CpaB [Chloroflexota bacterium]